MDSWLLCRLWVDCGLGCLHLALVKSDEEKERRESVWSMTSNELGSPLSHALLLGPIANDLRLPKDTSSTFLSDGAAKTRV